MPLSPRPHFELFVSKTLLKRSSANLPAPTFAFAHPKSVLFLIFPSLSFSLSSLLYVRSWGGRFARNLSQMRFRERAEKQKYNSEQCCPLSPVSYHFIYKQKLPFYQHFCMIIFVSMQTFRDEGCSPIQTGCVLNAPPPPRKRLKWKDVLTQKLWNRTVFFIFG